MTYRPSQWAETYISVMGHSLNFKWRPWWVMPYDLEYCTIDGRPARRKSIICAGRQVEKSLSVESLILMSNGSLKSAGEIQIGDRVAAMGFFGANAVVGEVDWVSRRYSKPCVKIRTRQGHEIITALTHPFRTWNSWTEAGDLRIRDRIAVARRSGEFEEPSTPVKSIIVLTAYMLGDGCTSGNFSFTSGNPLIADDFRGHLACLEDEWRDSTRNGTQAIHPRHQVLWGSLKKDGLIGKKSGEKFIPKWVFSLSKKDTSIFLNRLWATDGHVKKNSKSKWSLEYCSISSTLIKQVQSLLWKFGIPSRIRQFVPPLYRGTDRVAHLLRVETQDGVKIFLDEIGALGKSDGLTSADVGDLSNNNRDTLPIEILKDIQRIYDERPVRSDAPSLHEVGLRRSPKYPLTYDKLASYVSFFREYPGLYSPSQIDGLERHCSTDFYWDRIVSIEDVGEQECVDFSVADHRSFIADGIVTHNSTALANRALMEAAANPRTPVLYITPTMTQLSEFSFRRIDEVVSDSPFLKQMKVRTAWSVSRKSFSNGSSITLRSVYHTADRVRGLPAWAVFIDEVQDILTDNLPVIEETMIHCPWPLGPIERMLGTNKTFESPLEHYWSQESTMCEWMIKCSRCNRWNILTHKNIGPMGLVCDRCGKVLNPFGEIVGGVRQGAGWIRTGMENAEYEGFRIPQLLLPYSFAYDAEIFENKWLQILRKQRRYPKSKFFNEVLGLSWDMGEKPLSRQDLVDACLGIEWIDLSNHEARPDPSITQNSYTFCGVDWGAGSPSCTVLTAGRMLPDQTFEVFFTRRFSGWENDPEFALGEILRLLEVLNANYVGLDWGFGWGLNNRIKEAFGRDKTFVYSYTNQRDRMKMDPSAGAFLVNRTAALSDIFQLIKSGGIKYRCDWKSLQDSGVASDLLSSYQGTTRDGRLKYDHPKGTTDDSLHALSYAFLVSQIIYPRPDLL